MSEKDPRPDIPMPLEEAAHHPHLLLLDEFEGEIDGRLKYHKSLYQYRNAQELDETDWPFRSEERGPMDEGFTALMEEYEKLGLVEVDDEEGKIYIYRTTETGSRVIRGLRRGLRKIRGEEAEDREETAELIAELNIDRSGNEIVEDEDVQEAKENPYQSDV
ncbi:MULTISPECIES: hypothetical protein [Haloarcula]|uniref:hypothetical protein n=1 Tax=Haloarcula TaxID=2237 RepID=UPI0023EC010D|nr:hypothetical protein [Halomicroarcula sp. XH51]